MYQLGFDFQAYGLRERRYGSYCPLKRTGVDSLNRPGTIVRLDGRRCGPAALVQRDIGTTQRLALRIVLGFAVADEEDAHRISTLRSARGGARRPGLGRFPRG